VQKAAVFLGNVSWQYPLMVIIFSLFVHENDVSKQFFEMIRFVAFKAFSSWELVRSVGYKWLPPLEKHVKNLRRKGTVSC